MRTEAPEATATRKSFGWGPLILLAGYAVAPIVLVIAFNSYSAPDDAAYVRMAFASVAGATIGLLSSAVAVIYTFRHSRARAVRLLMCLASAFLAWQATGALAHASELLLLRLSLN